MANGTMSSDLINSDIVKACGWIDTFIYLRCLTGHEAGNGRHSQGTPTAHCALLYSEIAHCRMVAGRGILRNHGRNNNSPATGSNPTIMATSRQTTIYI